MQPSLNYTCPKCGHTVCEIDQFRATGGMLAKIFDVQNRHFTTVTCARCKYTEMYKAHSHALGDLFDFFTN